MEIAESINSPNVAEDDSVVEGGEGNAVVSEGGKGNVVVSAGKVVV